MDRAVKALRASLETTGGATVSLARGDLAGLSLFAVAAFPKRTLEINTSPTADDIWRFIMDNLDVLVHQNRAVGSWFDDQQSIHSLDVVVCFEQRDHALKVAARLRQRSIYDLSARVEIAVDKSLRLAVDSAHLQPAGAFGLEDD